MNNGNVLGYNVYRIAFSIALLLLSYVFRWLFLAFIICYVMGKVLLYAWEKFLFERYEGQGRGIFITGCDSGFGFMFAERLDAMGFTVFAGCLDLNSQGAKYLRTNSSKRVHVIRVDVTKDPDVAAVVTYIRKHLPRKGLWGLVNNAGIFAMGEVELTPVSMYQRGFNVNFYGAVRVIRACLPLIRHSKGRVVIVSSIHGLMSVPGRAVYEASKHALETMADSLRLEMIKMDVKVSLIEPGAFAFATSIANESALQRQKQELSDMWNAASAEVRKTYPQKQLTSRMNEPKGSWPPDAVGGYDVIAAVEHALCTKIPRSRYFVWGDRSNTVWHIAAALYSVIPTWIMDRYIIWADKM